jgi:hypothetical protein
MYDTPHPKAGGDNCDRFIGTGSDLTEPLTGGAGVGSGGFATTEDWSTWPSNAESTPGSPPVPDDADNTAMNRIQIPL